MYVLGWIDYFKYDFNMRGFPGFFGGGFGGMDM
jgi:DnaJ family protein A protein 2